MYYVYVNDNVTIPPALAAPSNRPKSGISISPSNPYSQRDNAQRAKIDWMGGN